MLLYIPWFGLEPKFADWQYHAWASIQELLAQITMFELGNKKLLAHVFVSGLGMSDQAWVGVRNLLAHITTLGIEMQTLLAHITMNWLDGWNPKLVGPHYQIWACMILRSDWYPKCGNPHCYAWVGNQSLLVHTTMTRLRPQN